MPLYECVLIARNDVTQQQVEAIADQVAATLDRTHGGEIKKREYWGLRGLAYRIKKNRKAHYMLLGLDCHAVRAARSRAPARPERGRAARLTLRIEEIDEAPSAILARRGDDRERDRGFRGPRPAGRFGSGRTGPARGDDREEFRARPRDELDRATGGEE